MSTSLVSPAQRCAVLALALLVCACRGTGPGDVEYPVLIPERTVATDRTRLTSFPPPTRGPIDHAASPSEDLVQLHVRTSGYARHLALHPWFLVYDRETDAWEQWEIWAGDLFGTYENRRTAKRHFSDGREPEPSEFAHVQYGAVRNWRGLTHVDGGSIGRVLGQWSGERARRLIEVLRRPADYPANDGYRIWPGPNSNGYPRWVLAEAGVPFDFDPKMVGKDWRGPFAIGIATAQTGVFVDVLTFGVQVGLREGVEVHLLGATFGLDLWPPALETPLGRLGFDE